MQVMSLIGPRPGQTKRQRLVELLVLSSRVALVLRLCRFVLVDGYRHVRARSLAGSINEVYSRVRNLIIRLILSLPSSRAKLASELSKTREDLRKQLVPKTYPDGINLTAVRTLPGEGKSREWLEEEWRNLRRLEGGSIKDGRVSGTVYHGGEELNKVIIDAMSSFLLSNPLHSDVFPSVRKMESEIISMCLNLFNGPNGAGTTTSGGTESILLAVKTYRDWAKDKKGIVKPEMVIPSSAHAAFYKAAQYFGIKMHVIPVDEATRKANVNWMERAVNANTIMMVASAPNFPDGVIDPIPALAAIAKRRNIALHVDCCLGSFLMPFLGRAGYGDGVERFDFGVDGVTSISCDIHKYGFCPKGCSVIMYRSAELRRYQYFVLPDWSGGLYPSPSMAGSRPGALLAGSWAVMNRMGVNGYTGTCRTIVNSARSFAAALRIRFPTDLYVLGDPLVSVVAFASKTVGIYAVGDAMSKKGWHLNALTNPPALHMAFTIPTSSSVDKLLDDLEAAIQQVKKDPPKSGNLVALYGLGQTSFGPHIVGEVAKTYLDVLYE